MKKEYSILFFLLAFVIGMVVGVVATVFYQEEIPTLPSSIKPAASPTPAPLTADVQEKISTFKAILKDDPKNLKALVELGNLYFDSDQFDLAIQAYSKALEIDPRNPDVLTDMGIMYRRKGDFDRAVAEFKKAAEIDPRHVNSRYNLGVVLLHDKGDLKGAIKAWEDYLKVDPASPRAENIRTQLEKMRKMAEKPQGATR